MYYEYPPDIRLAHLIDTYWVAEGTIEHSFRQGILPDGCVDIIFDFGHNVSTRRPATGMPDLVGTITSLLEITYPVGEVHMMGIRFAPGGITALTRVPLFELTDQNVELALIDNLLDEAFYQRLPELPGMHERIAYLNQYFTARLNTLFIPDERVTHAISFIRANNGQLSVKQLAEETCLSERQFERRFKATIGISPKQFNNIIRFRYTRRYVKTHPGESMYEVALACGYHDHSHMYKAFRQLGNLSPSDLNP